MSDPTAIEMDAAERDAFLGNGGTGVVSVETGPGTAPHSIPVSYGYDAVDTVFFFRLAKSQGEGKESVDEKPVSFVVHGETDEGWKSVVASGQLERTNDAAIGTAALEELQRVDIPYVDIFDRPIRVVEFEFYRLDPDQLHGRKASAARE